MKRTKNDLVWFSDLYQVHINSIRSQGEVPDKRSEVWMLLKNYYPDQKERRIFCVKQLNWIPKYEEQNWYNTAFINNLEKTVEELKAIDWAKCAARNQARMKLIEQKYTEKEIEKIKQKGCCDGYWIQPKTRYKCPLAQYLYDIGYGSGVGYKRAGGYDIVETESGATMYVNFL